MDSTKKEPPIQTQSDPKKLATDLHDRALRYADMGYKVFRCKVNSKAPATPNGFKDATTDTNQIDEWWGNGEPYNIGIATEGLVIVDIDLHKEANPGSEARQFYDHHHLELLDSPAVVSASGGMHFYYKDPNGSYGSKNDGIAKDVDVKAAGGYIIAPGSVFKGGEYKELPDRQLERVESLPEVPHFVAEAIQKKGKRQPAEQQPSRHLGGQIGEGSRNATLTSEAGKLRRAGMDRETILAALQSINVRECNPPLENEEVRTIAYSISKYEPGMQQEIPEQKPWQPFPVDCLPEVLAEFVTETAKSRQVDASMVALPLLSAIASAVGGSRCVFVKPDWVEPCILWTAIVAPSGAGKTPAAATVLESVRERDAKAIERNETLLTEYRADCEAYERAKKSKDQVDDLPPEPRPPQLIRHHLQDVTPEKLLMVLQHNPRGVLIARDELSGMFGGFGRYTNDKAGTDRAKYLSCWSADHLSDDRKTSESAHARKPHASIFGGIQPDLLFKTLGDEDIASGLPARFLFAWPPVTKKRWCDLSVSKSLTTKVSDIFDHLFSLDMKRVTYENDDPERVEYVAQGLSLTDEAQSIFADWFNECEDLVAESTGALRAALSKMRGQTARLSLILQMASWASGEGVGCQEVDELSMQNAITIARWFIEQAERVYTLQAESEKDKEERELIDWIRNRGGEVTARDLARGPSRYRGSGVAEKALGELADRERGSWRVEQGDKGRPVNLFSLNDWKPCDTKP